MREAIETFIAPPHNCRVFNLSLGSGLTSVGNKQSAWAEQLDLLARELKVLLVVSAGNNANVLTQDAQQAEQILDEYPEYLLEQQNRLGDPGTAAIALTVGALCEHNVVAVRQGAGRQDIIRAVAEVNQPSPFTRIGPGIGGAIKPEFVDVGGNVVFDGTAGVRRISLEPGTAVMSFSHQPTQRLFAFDVGTSFAAPRVARYAALVWSKVRELLGREPDANLVRAVLASAADLPLPVDQLLGDTETARKVCGYGQIDLDLALNSADRRVTLVAQGTIQLDRFAVYEVPIPPEFVEAPGQKTIRVALAYDPPVRRRRLDYLGVEMNFQMIRGKTLDEVVNAYRHVEPGEEPDRAITGASKIDFEPRESTRNAGYSRKKSTLQMGTFAFRQVRGQYGNSYWLVVRAERKWAPVELEHQEFGLAVTLGADQPDLYNLVSLRIQQALRARVRV